MPQFGDYTDKELVALLKEDDDSAFTELYNRHWKTLYYTALSILQNPEACRDIVQDVFISLWQRRKEVTIEFPKTYLQQAARFQVFKAIHSEKTTRDFYQRLAGVSSEIQTENPLLYKELEKQVQDLLNSLPEDARTAFLLNRDEKLTYHEIAEKMDISVKTVEKKMSRTLKILRKGLGDSVLLFCML